jgi:hypothetical protein
MRSCMSHDFVSLQRGISNGYSRTELSGASKHSKYNANRSEQQQTLTNYNISENNLKLCYNSVCAFDDFILEDYTSDEDSFPKKFLICLWFTTGGICASILVRRISRNNLIVLLFCYVYYVLLIIYYLQWILSSLRLRPIQSKRLDKNKKLWWFLILVKLNIQRFLL